MKASGSCRRMESRAPVSSVVRASPSSWGGVPGVGRRASRFRSCRLAVERREAIFGGEGDGVDCSCVSVVLRSVVDMSGGAAEARSTGRKCLGCDLPQALVNPVERIERSAIIAGEKPARSAAERFPTHVIRPMTGVREGGPKARWSFSSSIDKVTFLYLVDFVDA